MESEDKCPLCKGDAAVSATRLGRMDSVSCKRCGDYLIEFSLREGFKHGQISDPHLISGFTRDCSNRYRQNEERLDCRAELVSADEIRAIHERAPYRIPDKVHRILLSVQRRTDHFGELIPLSVDEDYPIGYAKNASEFRALLEYSIDRGFLRSEHEELLTANGPSRRGGPAVLTAKGFVLTAEGFAEIESHERANVDSEKAFVAMWFDDEMKPMYDDAIDPAIRDAGYRPVRVDQEEFNGDVVDRILAEIREARFIVADFTDHRRGVYFEAGFALGLSLPVVWLCREDDIGGSHFDTEHFNHIAWNPDEPAALRERLANRIRATIGVGPLKNAVT